MKLIDKQGKEYLVESIGSKWGIVKDKNGSKQRIPMNYLIEECQRLDEDNIDYYDFGSLRGLEDKIKEQRDRALSGQRFAKTKADKAIYAGLVKEYDKIVKGPPMKVKDMVARVESLKKQANLKKIHS